MLISSITLVDTLLTFWPPVPPDREKVQRIASLGIVSPHVVCTSSSNISSPLNYTHRRCMNHNVDVEIFETPLPGIGVRYEFDTETGRRLGVLVHRDGHRDMLVYCEDDVDSCSETLRLSLAESASLVELLGGTKITERLSDLRHEVQGLSIEWVSLDGRAPLAGKNAWRGRPGWPCRPARR